MGIGIFADVHLGYKISDTLSLFVIVGTWLPRVGRIVRRMLSSCASSIASNTIRGWLHMQCCDD